MTPDTPNTSYIVRLVLGVARLGENDLRGGWQGHALDRTGPYMLSKVFRRTWRPAALQLDVSAAARIQDELLGRSTALHCSRICCRLGGGPLAGLQSRRRPMPSETSSADAPPVDGRPECFLAETLPLLGPLQMLNAGFRRLSRKRAGKASTLRLDMRIGWDNTHNLLAPYHPAKGGLPASAASEDPQP
jgi:hypothetical protein